MSKEEEVTRILKEYAKKTKDYGASALELKLLGHSWEEVNQLLASVDKTKPDTLK